ncbi:G6PDH family F420-dependent oxidoreductase [Halopolyspora algeriensis]|uniref:G6PDH family F420-dependent oxidoreductase n=1 Tax=Halopolyspora algeriensis TaxID=1500506 RepID=A0A368VWR1_9ACTN|nr:TIGR03557 family F420-dependent LLM class oxidoreductase [Halopolyspora algeriensis]RCW44597.1 G6PDH family F420-dependent oxidoreductase [Halopolyspora algeriensis]TQM55958.1 G6PDH family F420-dependent oxidoreductase [Halopolyspora algeriensis]
MVRFGYTLLTEQAGPQELVRHAPLAERAGFDFEVMSDHYSPWLDSQSHSPYAWSVLGAVAQATERVELMTYVTTPTIRYHPAVVAQKAATIALLSNDRFTLGLGAGENLNEHVVARGWPPVNVRHEMLSEAVDIIGSLFDGGYLDYAGDHYRVDSAKLWDLPSTRPSVAVAVSGPQSVRRFAPRVDAMISTEPDAQLCRAWEDAGGPGRRIGQIPVCWDSDRQAAVQRAHEQFRWFAGGWKVNAELPGPASFAAATQFVRPEDVAASIPCGPEADPIVTSASAFWKAGYTDIALVQVGGDRHQDGFFDFAGRELLPALREAAEKDVG